LELLVKILKERVFLTLEEWDFMQRKYTARNGNSTSQLGSDSLPAFAVTTAVCEL